MNYWLGVFVFVVGVLVSVMIHEWGHFAMARRFGCKVTEFFVGFGPKLWSVRRGETEYGVKAIPAGGYVKIIGMTDLEPVDPGDESRAFYGKPGWQRAIVLSAGSFMHMVIGFVLLMVTFMAFGTTETSTSVSSVSACVQTTLSVTCGPGSVVSPAKAAGLQAGDTIVAVDGQPVATWTEITDKIRAAPGRSLTVTVRRGDQNVDLTMTPYAAKRPDPNDASKTVTVGAVGVAPGLTQHRYGPIEAVGQSVTGIRDTITGSAAALASLPQKVGQLVHVMFSNEPRDPNGLVGVVGAARISGDIAADNSSFASRFGALLFLLAGFNIFVGIFNMLPLLPLDGGHVAVLAYERMRAWWAHRRGEPEPARPDMNKLMPIAYVVFILFVGLTVLLVAADVIKPGQL